MSLLWGSRSRSRRKVSQREYSPFASSPEASRNRAVGQTVDDDGDRQEDDEEAGLLGRYQIQGETSYFDRHGYEEEERYDEDGAPQDEDEIDTPLLPIFSAAHLDRLPMYNITHAIRLLIVQRCETTLSWDQLRSPQVSQFLVKPIQSQIQLDHFNRATLCALLANCLQFQKEAGFQPGNVGVLRTRALISELLAMRLVKEFTTRELIDALSYDFDPLQGMSPPTTAQPGGQRGSAWPVHQSQGDRHASKVARVSTIEVAIKAQAKRFLAHQLVVQHLEAIWAGTVVFHSEADNLHRKPPGGELLHRHGGYGTIEEHSPSMLPADTVASRKAPGTRTTETPNVTERQFGRRSVTIYNPRDASLFKLSRLRVPRYRQIFSTLSFATMLGLFIAVLVDRSLYITPLEVVFWFWSAGYMLDEIVGFTEQGFGLYILSFWNAFDLGILMLFIMYYCLRLYGIVVAEQGKHAIANAAYDVLSTTAILLFPRLFSVLDHYRYFSQLLIAFRMMAQDLIAILVLILITCSGFFVAFTLSFADERSDGNDVIYQLFQILMGFTPAVWDKWPGYNMLGKVNMTIFLFICHFLIVTILITVLTNSFMAIVQNANEEHQFLFAINTISMVKSDALFSYIAPTNVIGWMLSPLRYIMPFRQYVKFNRTVIKVSHFPMLFAIFTYERLVLSHSSYGPEDLLEKKSTHQTQPLAFSFGKAPDVVSPGHRLLREPSVISFRKDRALDEVFRRPYKGSTVRTTAMDMDIGRRRSTNAVDKWMQNADEEGGASPPLEQPRSVVERLETRRPTYRRAFTSDRLQAVRSRDFSMATRSMASDVDLRSGMPPRRYNKIYEEDENPTTSEEQPTQETDADGDEENNAESEFLGPAIGESALSAAEKENRTPGRESDDDEFFQTPTQGRSPLMQLSSGQHPQSWRSPVTTQGTRTPMQARAAQKGKTHARNMSSNTVFLAPRYERDDDTSSANVQKRSKPSTAKHTNSGDNLSSTLLNPNAGHRTPGRAQPRARPIMPPRQKTAPGGGDASNTGLNFVNILPRTYRQPSFNARALDLASDIGDNKWAPGIGIDAGGISGMPNSFSEQLLREREIERQREEERRKTAEEEKGMVDRIMLSRMHTLEEGFREVLKEIKGLSRSNANSSRRDSEVEGASGRREAVMPNLRQIVGDTRTRKSPRKRDQRGAKGNEGKSPVAVSSEEVERAGASEKAGPSDETREEQVNAGAGGDVERPGTAVRTPAPSSREA